jgi:hypothetical protein
MNLEKNCLYRLEYLNAMAFALVNELRGHLIEDNSGRIKRVNIQKGDYFFVLNFYKINNSYDIEILTKNSVCIIYSPQQNEIEKYFVKV